MPEIKIVEVYRYKGKMYPNLKEIQQEVENKIGKIIDSIPATLHPGDKLKIYAALVENRKELVDLLSVTITDDSDPEAGYKPNILEMFAKKPK